MKIRLNNKTIYLDPWSNFKGIPFARKNDYLFKIGHKPENYEGIYWRKNKPEKS